MAVFDARPSDKLFNAIDRNIVAFDSLFVSTPITYVWNTTGGDRVRVDGIGITTGGGGLPTGGTATKVRIDLDKDGDFDATFSNVSVPLTALVTDAYSFWKTLLKGHDTIYASTSEGGTLFGDFWKVQGNTALIGGQDNIVGGTGEGQNLYGDAESVGTKEGNPPVSYPPGTLTGGRDTIVANNTTGRSYLIGDARNVNSNSLLNGNADVLTGSDTQADTIAGDADRLSVGSVKGGNDTINGRGGDDFLIGDVRDVNRFPSSSGNTAPCGHDLINGGDGHDIIVGDVATIGENEVGQNNNASGGNDRLYGNDGNDKIYGEIEIVTFAFDHLGNDRIYGGDGDDELYGDFGNHDRFDDAIPPNTDIGGHDLIYGGAGNDIVFGAVGNDRLYGEADNDTMNGDHGDDQLYGGSGNDVLIGSIGNDRLTGDAGNDQFRFFEDSAVDQVLDFEDDIDKLQISSAYGYADAAAVVATATVAGDDMTLHLTADDTITLVDFGTDPNALLNDIVII